MNEADKDFLKMKRYQYVNGLVRGMPTTIVVDITTGNEMSSKEFTKLSNEGRLSKNEMVGYKKVKSEDGVPLTLQKRFGKELNEFSVFKMVNLYGAGRIVAEYPSLMTPSPLDNNTFKVEEELTDNAIIAMLAGEAIQTNPVELAKEILSAEYSQEDRLNALLDEAVANEDYERAASIRDEINELTSKEVTDEQVTEEPASADVDLASFEADLDQLLKDGLDALQKANADGVKFILGFHGGQQFEKPDRSKQYTGEFRNLEIRRIAESMGARYEGQMLFFTEEEGDDLQTYERAITSASLYALRYGNNNPTVYAYLIPIEEADFTDRGVGEVGLSYDAIEQGKYKEVGRVTTSLRKSRVIKVDQYQITVQPDGKMLFANGTEVTDQTIKNKVDIKIAFQDGTLRISVYNNNKYFVLSNNKIFGSGKTNLGKETVTDPKIKQEILDKAVLYKPKC